MNAPWSEVVLLFITLLLFTDWPCWNRVEVPTPFARWSFAYLPGSRNSDSHLAHTLADSQSVRRPSVLIKPFHQVHGTTSFNHR